MRNSVAACLGVFLSFVTPVYAETSHPGSKTLDIDPIAVVAQAKQDRGLVVQRAGQSSRLLSPERFVALARITQRVSFMTGNGEQQNEWTGPLPWTVLDASGVIEGANQREQAHLVVRVTGADGYAAVIALGEISPLLADRPILLADQLNGTPLPDHALRLVVPGDRLGARSVRDVVRIEIE
jgi:DMSO/TMAO reductase YedYZ molybdopterin-dependent catalytic subunit